MLRRAWGIRATSTALWICDHYSNGAVRMPPPCGPEDLRRFLSSPPAWLTIVADPRPALAETESLDPGEASVITLAWQQRDSSLLIIDEKQGRRVSLELGIRITGTAGVLTDAASEGFVDFEATFQRLARTKFRLKSSVIDALRKRLEQRKR